jgi:hypothetical protein
MLGRRRIETSAPLRSSLADAAFAVEERVVWGGADAVRGIFEVIKWPFERLAWLFERGVLWPLEERTDRWGPSLRLLALAGLALLAAGAGVLGLIWASGSGSGGAPAQEAAAPAHPSAPVLSSPVTARPTPPAKPLLHGAKLDFTASPPAGPRSGNGGGAPAKAAVNSTSEVASSGTAAAGTATASNAPAESPGPAATKVAHQFTSAFVLYEIGHETPAVRHAFTVTATPRLAERLLKHPPRLPANVKVPKAKVLNIVAGPRHGDTYTLSASLLRVGVTSELRLTVERAADGSWQVANILG